MGIGTSMGAYYDDAFHQATAIWDKKYDDNAISPNQVMPPDPVDPAEYDTKLTPDEEVGFQEWKSKMAPNDSGYDYDLRGAYKDNLQPAENGHWPDTYKKPNHPTFSDQSKYSIDRPDLAGTWNGDIYVSPKAIEANLSQD